MVISGCSLLFFLIMLPADKLRFACGIDEMIMDVVNTSDSAAAVSKSNGSCR